MEKCQLYPGVGWNIDFFFLVLCGSPCQLHCCASSVFWIMCTNMHTYITKKVPYRAQHELSDKSKTVVWD